MLKLLFILITYCAIINADDDIDTKIDKYFHSSDYLQFQKLWQPHRSSFEEAIVSYLVYGYGKLSMNIYVRRFRDNFLLSEGTYINDNVVQIILFNMNLLQLPRLTYPRVTFALASNLLRVESPLSTMIIRSEVSVSSLFGKSSTEEDPYKTSPFNFPEVNNRGNIAIIADQCSLVGYVLVRLDGESVTLGHDTFHVTDCKFTVEITPQSGGPPVIAPYFSVTQAQTIEKLLTKPVRAELLAVLQGVLYSYLNMTVVLGSHLPQIQKSQHKIILETKESVRQVVQHANVKAAELNRLAAEMGSFSINWVYVNPDGEYSVQVMLQEAKVYGLDLLHSAHTGAPYKLESNMIGETLRFSSLMIRGKVLVGNHTLVKSYSFVAEVKDVEVHIEFDMEKYLPYFEVMNWRSLEISLKRNNSTDRGKMAERAVIIAYIGFRLPSILQKHLEHVIGVASGRSPSPVSHLIDVEHAANSTKIISKDDDHHVHRGRHGHETVIFKRNIPLNMQGA